MLDGKIDIDRINPDPNCWVRKFLTSKDSNVCDDAFPLLIVRLAYRHAVCSGLVGVLRIKIWSVVEGSGGMGGGVGFGWRAVEVEGVEVARVGTGQWGLPKSGQPC